jgi:hypothetical protein
MACVIEKISLSGAKELSAFYHDWLKEPLLEI